MIEWECKDCGYCWTGDDSDAWCDNCDEGNLEPRNYIKEEKRREDCNSFPDSSHYLQYVNDSLAS